MSAPQATQHISPDASPRSGERRPAFPVPTNGPDGNPSRSQRSRHNAGSQWPSFTFSLGMAAVLWRPDSPVSAATRERMLAGRVRALTIRHRGQSGWKAPSQFRARTIQSTA